MARWTPDPSFYPSPGQAAQAPPETLAYVATLNTGSNGDRAPDALTRARPRAGLADLRAARRPASTCPTSATSCTTSAGTRAPRRCARGRRTRTSSAATCSCRACAPRRSMSSTSRTIRARPKIVEGDRGRGDRPQGRLQPPAHGPLRPRRDLRLRARRPGGRRPGRHLPARPRRLLGQGRVGGRPRHAGAGLRLLVAPRLRHRDHERVGHAEDGRGRPGRRAAARQQVRPQAARLGPQEAPPHAGDRPRAGAPDGARAAPGARPVARRTGSSASSPRRPTCPPRSGCGSARDDGTRERARR